jgi:hypothetical protein
MKVNVAQRVNDITIKSNDVIFQTQKLDKSAKSLEEGTSRFII